MSARKKMLQSAIHGMMKDFDNDLKRVTARTQMENEPYIFKDDDHMPYINCHMCGSKDCEEFKLGNKKYSTIHVIDLCKDCQKTLADFLTENLSENGAESYDNNKRI